MKIQTKQENKSISFLEFFIFYLMCLISVLTPVISFIPSSIYNINLIACLIGSSTFVFIITMTYIKLCGGFD